MANKIKTCGGCNNEKDLSKFGPNKATKDGLDYYCRQCRRAKNLEQELKPITRKYREIYNQSEKGKKLAVVRAIRYQKENKEIRLAHMKVKYAIDHGNLHKQPCEVCGCGKVEAHHDDYSKPLEVTWLCRTHHREHHRIMV